MNAPTSLTRDRLDTFIPGCGPEERILREAILKARDLATSRLPALETPHARQCAWQMVEVATEWAFRPASIADLQDVRMHLLRLMRCITFAEQMELGE